jgi:iron-sulfur cluster insertion protein
MAEVFVPTPIHLTERAVSKVKELISGEGNPDLHLRVFVTGGGCSDSVWISFDE